MAAKSDPAAGPSTLATLVGDREMVATRIVNAPRELVFQLFTERRHIEQWWGPKGFTTTTYQMDVRTGGVWRFCMHGPDGRDYENRVTYLEVAPPERLAFRHGGDEECEPVLHETVITFEDLGGKTRLTFRMAFPSSAARDVVVREYGALQGLDETLTRMEGHLAAGAPPDEDFVISRTFRAPRDLVFKIWTQREHLMKWFGPKGFTIPQCTNDFRPGGTLLYCMRSPAGPDMWGKWTYREIVPPRRLVFVMSFSDAAGGLTVHPMMPDWPRETLSTVVFTEHGDKTTVTIRWSALNATAAERKVFNTSHDSMRQGWGGTLEKLTEYVAGF